MAASAPLTVGLFTQGTRGDFQPMLALAVGLRSAGHRVHVFANPGHCEAAKQFGFDGSTVGPEAKDILESEHGKRAMDTGDLAAAFKGMVNAENDDTDWHAMFLEALKMFPVDIMVYTPLVQNMIHTFSMQYPDVPAIYAQYQPNMVSNEIEPTSLFRVELEEGQPILFKWQLMLQFSCQTAWKLLQDAKEQGTPLPPHAGPEHAFMESFDWADKPTPLLQATSPAFWPLPDDFPKAGVLHVGRWAMSKEQQEANARGGGNFFDAGSELGKCSDFIKAGTPPVYIGWGSMTVKSKEHMAILAVDALRIAGQRGIIVSGWADVNSDSLTEAENTTELQSFCKDNVFFMKSAPHEWLFPQCAACVHHGGVGTAQASLGCGSPTIVTPVFADQFDIAGVITRSGWGMGTKPLPKLTAVELGEAIRKVCGDKGMKDRAAALAAKMAKEDGVETTVEYLETFMRDEVRTGKWKQKEEAWFAKAAAWRKKNEKMSLEAVMYALNNVLSKRYPPLREYTGKAMAQFEQLALTARAGKLYYVKGTSVLARAGKELKSDEVGRYKEFALLELVEQVKSRMHVKRLKGMGPAEGWITPEVNGKEIVVKVAAQDLSKIEADKYKKLFADILPD